MSHIYYDLDITGIPH